MSDTEATAMHHGDHDVPTLYPRDMEENLLIGVCGVQAAGKTVFLTSIFHTMTGEDVEGIGHVSFDREDKGGALYFERVENEIRERGRITPTREPAVARLLVEPLPAAGLPDEEVGVVLFDFAGRYFTEFSDLPRARAAAETPQEREELDLVNRYLERCDGFIILVDSTNFSADEVAGRQIPFPASIAFLRTHCRRLRRPLALVFTKKDMNPDLTTEGVEGVESFELVRKFRTVFSEDPADGRPFGFVAHLSCYEIDDTGDVLEQTSDGSIWRREPSQVFTRVLRAIWPKAVEARRAKRAAEDERNRSKELARQRSRRWKQALAAAGVLLAIAIPLLYTACDNQRRLQEAIGAAGRVAAHLDQGNPDRIDGSDLDTVRRLGTEGDEEAAAAWNELGVELSEAYAAVEATYPLGGDEKAATSRLLELGQVLGAAEGTPVEMLGARLRYLQAPVPDDPAHRLARVNESIREADGLGDHAFQTALESEAARLREQVASAHAQPGYAKSNVTDRARFVRARLRDLDEGDPEVEVLARTEYGRLLGSSLTALAERQKLISFLTSAFPSLSHLLSDPDLGSQHVLEYRTVRRELTASRELDELHALRGRVASLIEDMATRDEAERVLLVATLEDLFRGLGSNDRKRVWAAFLEGAESEYLFELRRDAWPESLRPWIQDLRAALADDRTFAAASLQAIQEIAEQTLYWVEIRDVAGVAAVRYLDLATVRCYRDVIDQVQNGYSPASVSQRLRDLASLAESMQEEHSAFGSSTAVFDARRREAVALADRAALAGAADDERRLLRDLTNGLTTVCTTRLDSSADGCSS